MCIFKCIWNTVKSQIEAAVSIDFFEVKNIEKASIQGRLLIKFPTAVNCLLKLAKLCTFSPNLRPTAVSIQGWLLFQFSSGLKGCGYYSRAVSIRGRFLIETLRYVCNMYS